jgi:DNA-binding response OmpR family regulator
VNKQAAERILIVDDDPAFREIAARILQQAGYETREASTGREALQVARRDRPLLVVLDVRLRGELSGYEVCRILKNEVSPEPAILFVSGARVESFDRVGGLLVGADDYVIKPFAADELLARVRALIRRSTPRTAVSQLTSRELEVARLLKEGLSQAEIARKLEISRALARRHIEHILARLGV